MEIEVQCVQIQKNGEKYRVLFANALKVLGLPALTDNGLVVLAEGKECSFVPGRLYKLKLEEIK